MSQAAVCSPPQKLGSSASETEKHVLRDVQTAVDLSDIGIKLERSSLRIESYLNDCGAERGDSEPLTVALRDMRESARALTQPFKNVRITRGLIESACSALWDAKYRKTWDFAGDADWGKAVRKGKSDTAWAAAVAEIRAYVSTVAGVFTSRPHSDPPNTEKQIEILRRCLGLFSAKEPEGNRFLATEFSSCYRQCLYLCDQGLMACGVSIGQAIFFATEKGAALVGVSASRFAEIARRP